MYCFCTVHVSLRRYAGTDVQMQRLILCSLECKFSTELTIWGEWRRGSAYSLRSLSMENGRHACGGGGVAAPALQNKAL